MINNAACAKCSFYDEHATAVQAPKTDGLCRYNPPVSQPGPEEHGLWPIVSSGDWCGHFSPDMNSAQVAAE